MCIRDRRGTTVTLHITDEEKEFLDTCNEFRWLSLYISKGVCREELYYAKHAYDVLIMPMFLKMLNWRIGTEHGFRVTTGSSCRCV